MKISAILLTLTSLALLTSIANNPNSSIHIISPSAVYIEGEACVINAGKEREPEELENDWQGCLAIHELVR
jgi:hypothetical protein